MLIYARDAIILYSQSYFVCFFVWLFLESAEIKPQKLIFKPSILSDVAKNLATSSSKSLYTNINLYLNFLTQWSKGRNLPKVSLLLTFFWLLLKTWTTREKYLVVRYDFQALIFVGRWVPPLQHQTCSSDFQGWNLPKGTATFFWIMLIYIVY